MAEHDPSGTKYYFTVSQGFDEQFWSLDPDRQYYHLMPTGRSRRISPGFENIRNAAASVSQKVHLLSISIFRGDNINCN